jgi:hypothetical protein
VLRSWKKLSGEDRVALLYAPILLAAIGAALAFLVTIGAPAVARIFNDPKPDLELVDADLAAPYLKSNDPGAGPSLSVKLYNAGDRRAVLEMAEFKVVAAYEFPDCFPEEGSGTPETGRYSIALPSRPKPGYRKVKRINQEVGPDEADRFTFLFETAEQEGVNGYVLEGSLRYHGADDPVSIDRFLILTPATIAKGDLWEFVSDDRSARRRARRFYRDFFGGPDTERDVLKCIRRNRKSLPEFLRTDASRAPELRSLKRRLRGFK